MELEPYVSILETEKTVLLVVTWLEEEPLAVDNTREPVELRVLIFCEDSRKKRLVLVEEWSELLETEMI